MTEEHMTGDQSIKDFLISCVRLMQEEETDLVTTTVTLPDGTAIDLEIVVVSVRRPN